MPPEAVAELLGLDREMRKLPVDRSKLIAAAANVVAAWVDAHMQKLVPPGQEAARAGGPRSPGQVAQLVALAKQLDCLPEEIAGAVDKLRTEARSIGETHLTRKTGANRRSRS